MLRHLSIRDLVLIERVELELAEGLTVLTGETGAGKSILLDGLGLALGERADPALVRRGAAMASVTAQFALAPGHPVLAALAEQDLPADPDLILRRTLKADGGSRAFVNDQPVSATLLRTIGSLLVEVHGQNDDRGLLHPRGHLALLDAFAGHDGLLAGVASAHAQWTSAKASHQTAQAQAEADARDREWLAHAVQEIAALAPEPGEESRLADTRATMQKGARLAESLDAIDTHVSAADGALSQLRQAGRRLERIADADPALAQALDAVDRALVAGDAIETALASVRARFHIAPDALEQAEARLFELRAMARKHRVEVDALADLGATLASRLAAVDSAAGSLSALQAAEAKALAVLQGLAETLSAARQAAAARLDAAVNAELPALKLDRARFRSRIEAADLSASGSDALAFEVATNAGDAFGALTKIASGGEMSRFVLALKVALASRGSATTLIFDEIDRGVGGATASAIGQRLRRVAATAQLLVVTHSPQVAAAGAQHLRIEKAEAGGETRTSVTPLDPQARVEEVARMLSGTAITAEARAQASQLLAEP